MWHLFIVRDAKNFIISKYDDGTALVERLGACAVISPKVPPAEVKFGG